MDRLRQDLRFAVRSLLRRPAFAAVAIATLALGIGVNTGMFSIVRAVLLERLPYVDTQRLVRVHHVSTEGGVGDGLFSPLDYEDLAAASTSFERLAAFWHAPGLSNVTITGAGEATLLETAYVSPDFFPALGAVPQVGRLPLPEEMQEGSDRVLLLSHGEWRRRFGGDPEVVGSTVTLQGHPHTVLGVMPPAFAYPTAAVKVWLPLSHVTDAMIPRQRGIRYLGVIGRLTPDRDHAAAAAELGTITRRLADAYPESNRDWQSVRLQPLRDEVLGDVHMPLVVLSIAVGLVLLIACANLLNLLLARASSRRSEFAVRSALGAERTRMVRQLVTESTVLALAGGAAGLLLAAWLTALVPRMGGADLPRVQEVRIDAVVIGFGLLLSVLTGVLTGLVPAWRAAGSSAATLRDAGRGGTESRPRQRLRGALVASEMALAVVLVIAAGLMLRSLTTLLRVEPGFDAERVLAVSLTIPTSRAGSLPESIVYRNLLHERLTAIPGVSSVGYAKTLPLEAGGEPVEFTVPSQDGATFSPASGLIIVSPDYFTALGVPLLRGRTFDHREMRNADGFNTGIRGAVVINQTSARTLFGDGDPLGRHLQLGDWPLEIVGVVADMRHGDLHSAPGAAVYIPIDISPRLSLRFLLRTDVDPASLTAVVRDAIRQLEPDQPIAEIVPLTETVRRAAARERFLTLLLGGFGGLALLLAAIGIYGVVAYGVSQRMREMGIRIALGAKPSAVATMVVAQSALWWGSGLAAGLVLAAGATRLLESLVYGVSVTDAPTFAGVAVLLGSAALLASVIPAVRASRADPVTAFR